LHPAVRVLVKERIGHDERFPLRNRQSVGSVKIRADTLIKEQIGALRVVPKLYYVELLIGSPGEDGLRTTAKLSNKLD
jgi:hypothetical protein